MAEFQIAPERLHHWVLDLFTAAGSDATEARLAADHLVGANLSGHDSHGVGMIPKYVAAIRSGNLVLNRRIETVVDHGPVITIDAGQGLGQSVTHQAMALAIERARQYGVCVMGLRHTHHLGRVGHWAEQAIAAGFVSIHFTNANSIHVVAPHGGAEARFGTNPFTVGIPRRGRDPLLLDFATSAIAQGKARVAYNKGVPVPPGSLIDHEGRATTNPAVLFESPVGALLTFAGHKGYALSFVCEMLGAALTGGSISDDQTEDRSLRVWNNMLTIVIDPARLGDPDVFEAKAAEFEDWVRSSRLAPGADGILVPGDPERASRKARAAGLVIDAQTLAQLDEAAAQISASLAPLSSLRG